MCNAATKEDILNLNRLERRAILWYYIEITYIEKYGDPSTTGYIKKQLYKHKHDKYSSQKQAPCPTSPQKHGAATHEPTFRQFSNSNKIWIQVNTLYCRKYIVRYYARTVDLNVILELSAISSEYSKYIKANSYQSENMLDYLQIHPNATMR